VFGMGTGVALWVWAPTNSPHGVFLRAEKFLLFDIKSEIQIRLGDFPFRVSVGIEVFTFGSVIDPEDQAIDR
jgi:hypothetical protein